MIVDTSAIVAVAMREAAARQILESLRDDQPRRVSAANLLETWMVVGQRVDKDIVDAMLTRFNLTVEPVTA